MTKEVAVIGAGPAGMTAAYVLARGGAKVTVYEAAGEVGGMSRTFELWGQLIDVGPHRFFSMDPRINRLWLDLAGRDYDMVDRISRILYRGRFFDYPLKAFNALSGLGLAEAASCMVSYAIAHANPPANTDSFEDWVVSRFGRRLYSIFFKTYSEKLWGIPCTELDSDFAAQRIKKLSLKEAIIAAFVGDRGAKHKTLVDQFAYPREGTGMIYKRMSQRVLESGGTLRLSTRIQRVVAAARKGDRLKVVDGSGHAAEYDHVVSTMPITQLVDGMGAPADVIESARKLKFRNTILVYLKIGSEKLFPDQWLYIHSPELSTGRITNFSNWSQSTRRGRPETILCLEYWCNDGDGIWSTEDAMLVALAGRELTATGLVPERDIQDGRVLRVSKSYPVYSLGYKQHLAPVREYLSAQPGLSAIGRYGSFKYNNQDHSILMGMLAAENILHGASHDLWGLNSDYEYQESSLIVSTGLVVGDRHSPAAEPIKKTANAR